MNIATPLRRTALCGHLILLFAVSSVALATCPTNFDFITVQPSPRAQHNARAFQAWFECYNAITGTPGDCAFTYRVVGIEPPTDDIDNNGGHLAHGGVRPLVLGDHRNPGGAVIFRDDTDPAPLSVAGSTLSVIPLRGAPVLHRTPEVSGVLAIEGQITAPLGQFFCSFTEAGRVQPYHFTVDVRVPGLERLPEVGTDYQVVRGGRDTHPEGTFATRQTIETLLKIAKEYRILTGSQLSVNDLSLPAGGLFDYRNPWLEPHQTHREGVDADINRTNIAGTTLDCLDDPLFLKAIQTVAAGARLPKRHCESGGRKHIDF